MSKNSKNARKIRQAKERRGTTGPAKTTPKHGKVNTWHARLAGKVAGPAPKQKRDEAEAE
jgi:hypothetical protein